MLRFPCALVCVCWLHACLCCVRAVSSGGGYQGVLQPGRAAPAGGLRCLSPFIPSCLLSLLHPYKGGDMGGRRTYYYAGRHAHNVRSTCFFLFFFTAIVHSDIMLGSCALASAAAAATTAVAAAAVATAAAVASADGCGDGGAYCWGTVCDWACARPLGGHCVGGCGMAAKMAAAAATSAAAVWRLRRLRRQLQLQMPVS